MPLMVPHNEVQNISTLNFAFKLMPPHNFSSVFKEKKPSWPIRFQETKPFKIVAAQHHNRSTKPKHTYFKTCANYQKKSHPARVSRFPKMPPLLQISTEPLETQAGAGSCCPCWPWSCGAAALGAGRVAVSNLCCCMSWAGKRGRRSSAGSLDSNMEVSRKFLMSSWMWWCAFQTFLLYTYIFFCSFFF